MLKLAFLDRVSPSHFSLFLSLLRAFVFLVLLYHLKFVNSPQILLVFSNRHESHGIATSSARLGEATFLLGLRVLHSQLVLLRAFVTLVAKHSPLTSLLALQLFVGSPLLILNLLLRFHILIEKIDRVAPILQSRLNAVMSFVSGVSKLFLSRKQHVLHGVVHVLLLEGLKFDQHLDDVRLLQSIVYLLLLRPDRHVASVVLLLRAPDPKVLFGRRASAFLGTLASWSGSVCLRASAVLVWSVGSGVSPFDDEELVETDGDELHDKLLAL